MIVLSVASRAREIFESHLVQTSAEKKILYQPNISQKIIPPTRYISQIKVTFYGLAVVK